MNNLSLRRCLIRFEDVQFATRITPCHQEIRNTKMTQPSQIFKGTWKSTKETLSLHG